uniref:Transmembrane channel-like protein 2 n=1 Tax=Dermatophagoides pteronyssinus TaxID=6956 RepID=A0A6P6YHG3_DERPT|nr:transmembrane channel-like protein 2 [Dermatophagoides pteronyssinus]
MSDNNDNNEQRPRLEKQQSCDDNSGGRKDSISSHTPPPSHSPGGEVILKTKGKSSGSRRGSTTFLTSDDNIIMAFGSGRRLSSFCTTSSYEDTAISIGDEPFTEEEISETIRAHKQIIATMKHQNWPMYRKLKVLNRAKHYVKKHEGELKQSKQAKDLVAKWKVYMERSINRIKRELANLIVVITPWEMRIKKIESHFGSGVASYFIFLRWVFWVNIFISVFICCFLMVPEVLRGDPDPTGMRKEVEDAEESLKLQAIWDFEGYLKYSPIFYGYYSKTEMTSEGFRLPLAYFLTTFSLYMFSFFCILRKMAQNSRMSRVASKDDEFTFCWKVFTGWDYMIGNSETAYNKVASLVMSLKESILEEKERKKEERNWKLIAIRILTNIMVLSLLASSAYGVVLVVDRSQEPIENPSWLRANEVTLVFAGIGIVFPNIFDWIGNMEQFHPRIALRWQLGRILILNFLNMYTLMLSLFGKVDSMTTQLLEIKANITMQKMQLNTIALTTMATYNRIKRDGRDEYEDYDENQNDDYIMMMITNTPSIIYDPYEIQSRKKPDFSIEGRYHFNTDPEFENNEWHTTTDKTVVWQNLETTTMPTTIIMTANETFVTDDHRYKSNITTTLAMPSTAIKLNDSSSLPSRTTQPITSSSSSSTMTTTGSTLSPIRIAGNNLGRKRPGIRYKFGQPTITTTTEMITEQVFTIIPADMVINSCQNNTEYIITDEDLIALNETEKDRLRKLCWETMFGQELVKLTVMDFVLTVISTLISDFIRALIVRYCNGCTCICWDLEKGFPGYGDFKIAENILHLVNNQGVIWLGMFFSPGLPAINSIKLCLLMYVRSWAVLTCNIPHETVFKASRNNNFYFMLLLLMLFLCTLPVSYAVVWLEPSWHCGPFSGYQRIYKILSTYIESKLPKTLNKILDYLTSPGAVLPTILLLVLFIYYLLSSVSALKDANKELKSQVRKEKDISETGPPEMIVTSDPGVAATTSKHVRIQEDDQHQQQSKIATINGQSVPPNLLMDSLDTTSEI